MTPRKHIDGPHLLPKRSSILIYGAGGKGQNFRAMVEVERPDVKLLGFLDTFKSGNLVGLPVTCISDYNHNTNNIVVVCSAYADEILQELANRKIDPVCIFQNSRARIIGTMDITTRCNARCIFCGNINNPERLRGPDWDMTSFEMAFGHLAEADEICFCGAGGEPLLNKHLPEMLSICKARGKNTSFYTNGAALVSGQRLTDVAKHTDRIFLSFISPRPEIQDRFMLGANVETVKSNLKTMAASPQKFELIMNVLVMRENIGDLTEVVSFAGQVGVTQITFTLMRREGQSALNGLLLDDSSAEERRFCLNEINKCKKLAVALGISIYVSPNLETILKGSLEAMKTVNQECNPRDTAEPLTRLCALPWTHHIIYFSGTAAPCCSLNHLLGNAFKDSSPLFGGSKHEKLKHALLAGELFGPCTNCAIYPLGPLSRLHNLLGNLGVIIPERIVTTARRLPG